MDNMNLEQIDLTTPYTPVAIYYDDGDYVEYVRRDDPIVYRRVDEFLTLAIDMFSRDLVGFRLKGFRNFFINVLQKKYEMQDHDFIPLVAILEDAITSVGNRTVKDDQQTRDAYDSARKIAREDNPRLPPMPVAA